MEDLLDNLPTTIDNVTSDVLSKLESEIIFTEGVSSSKPMTVVERAVCEMRADKKTNANIATYLGISIVAVKRILAKSHVKAFLQELINAQYDLTKEYRLEILDKIISAKLTEIDRDLAGDFSKATRKDIVDLLVLQDSLLKEREKKELGTNEDTYVTLLQQIIKQ